MSVPNEVEVTSNVQDIVRESVIGLHIGITKKLITTNGEMEFAADGTVSRFDDFEFPSKYYGKEAELQVECSDLTTTFNKFTISEKSDICVNDIKDVVKISVAVDGLLVPIFTCRQTEVHNIGSDEDPIVREFEFIESIGLSIIYKALEGWQQARNLWIEGVRVFLYNGDYYELMSDPIQLSASNEKFYVVRYVRDCTKRDVK